MFYYEQKSMSGRWEPVLAMAEPAERNGRLARVQTTGPKIRGVKKISGNHQKLTLDQLREVYSPDGKFRNTGK